MHLPDTYEEQNRCSPKVVLAIVIVTLFVAVLLLVVLVTNQKNGEEDGLALSKRVAELPKEEQQKYPETQELLSGSKLKPEDLDFWDKYPEKQTEEDTASGLTEGEQGQEPVNDPATDGKHTKITYGDGTEEWVLISPYLPKQEYDFTKLVCQSDLMKYYVNGKQTSFVGVDISKFQDYVDFVKLKHAGVDYVMLRVGFRGYSSGQLVLDDYFLDNIKRAGDAGLKIGVYFFSQAITKEEAIEEANMVLQNIAEYQIAYPVAFDMEKIENDSARTENLNRAQRTEIAKAFMDTILAAGYKTILYGNKEWLIKQVDMAKLTDYDVWLSQCTDVPDYPYRFQMWQYRTDATIDGISGYADLNISFIDYTEK